MSKFSAICAGMLAATLGLANVGVARSAAGRPAIRHVLILSIDGAHALDVERYVEARPHSALAQLTHMGITYTNASLPIGDFFPGMMSLLTGGTPNSTGVWYDEGYDRHLSAAGSDCSTVGGEYVYDEGLDIDINRRDGGGGINAAMLPRDPRNGCKPVYPHQFLRVNTIFDVAKAAGLRTAWADKHWACEMVEGPTGHGVDDLFIREVGNMALMVDINRTMSIDDDRAQGIINEIDGFDHERKQRAAVPGVFGMTFQSLEIEQKVTDAGYLDGAGTPSAPLLMALEHTDRTIGRIVSELRKQKLFSSTLVIVTAVHGDSPIDRRNERNVSEDLIPGMIGESLVAKFVADTEAFIWLKDQSQTERVAEMLESPGSRRKADINEVLWGDSLKLLFNDPLEDSRAPDIIVKPYVGVFYASSKSVKIAEHGGFYSEDVNVPLLLANPSFRAEVIKVPVPTTSVAPTVLDLLGLKPAALRAVRMEKTPTLPGLP